MYLYTFFKEFLNMFFLISRIKRAKFLELRYKNKNLSFKTKNPKEEDNTMVYINVRIEK